jgi:hypothetical protein
MVCGLARGQYCSAGERPLGGTFVCWPPICGTWARYSGIRWIYPDVNGVLILILTRGEERWSCCEVMSCALRAARSAHRRSTGKSPAKLCEPSIQALYSTFCYSTRSKVSVLKLEPPFQTYTPTSQPGQLNCHNNV